MTTSGSDVWGIREGSKELIWKRVLSSASWSEGGHASPSNTDPHHCCLLVQVRIFEVETLSTAWEKLWYWEREGRPRHSQDHESPRSQGDQAVSYQAENTWENIHQQGSSSCPESYEAIGGWELVTYNNSYAFLVTTVPFSQVTFWLV